LAVEGWRISKEDFNEETEMMNEKKQVKALKAHLAINVRNVEQSIDFYKKLWGIEPSKVRTGYAKFDVQNPPLNFTLNQGSFANAGALSHLGIQVSSTEDVLAMREKWAADLLTREEMQTSCCYALQDKAWVRDPDGNEWEVFVVLEDNLAETAPCECGNKVDVSSSNPLAILPVETSACSAAVPAVREEERQAAKISCC
jgi:catechol 2,3-dioxygenase-like lactoylglutathione lyase family enzyme